MKPIIKASLVAIAISLLPFGAQAAGLGQFTVRSKLGQPLDVEIQVNATQQELQSLLARIAPPDSFVQANIPYASFVPNVRIAVENRGDRSVLKLRTDAPVNEAVASLIVQLNWDEGRVQRTYNFLLDPPDLAVRPPTPVVEPTVVVTQELPPPVVESPPTGSQSAQDSGPEPVPLPMPVPGQPSAPVQTAPVQTQELDLGDDPVAINYQSYREPEPIPEPVPESIPESVPESVPREVVASPPEPERPPVQPVPSPEPSPVPTYRETLATDYTVRSGDTLGVVASRHVPMDATLDQMMMALYRANQSAFIDNNINRLKSGAILKIPSASEVQSSTHADARREVRVHAREFNEWRERLAADVAGRPASQVTESSGMSRSIDAVPPPAEQDRDKVVIASSDAARQGSDAQRQRMEEELARTQSELKEAEERLRDLEEITRLQAQRDREIAKSQTQQQASAPVVETPAPVVETPEVPGLAASEPALPEPVQPEPAAVEPEPAKEPVSQEASSGITSDYDTEYKDPLMELVTDSKLLGAGALIIVFLGVFLGFRAWRNKRSDIGLDTLSQDATSMFPDETTSFFGDNGGQSVDTSASSVIHTDFSQTGLSIDTNEGVDPVAEADVYMAYGRDSQAEEILNDALKSDPKRGAIYVKLLEIYAQRQDLAQFEATASELLSRTDGHGRDWEKAAQMGRRLDPSNPLYSAGPSKQGSTGASKLPGLEPALEEPSRLDMGESFGPATIGGGPPALSDLDFGASPVTKSSAAGVTQLKKQEQPDISTTRVTPATTPGMQTMTGSPIEDVSSDVDFQFDPAETMTKAAGSLDFDLGKSQQAASDAGKQPISVTVSKPSKSSKQSTVPAGTASMKIDIKSASPKATNDLVGSLDFNVPVHDASNNNMTNTVVLPSMRDGNARGDEVTLDLEKTSFDPNALDFDLDLDLKPNASTKASIASKESSQPSAPVGGLANDAMNAGEIDTKLELALAYRDMGDNEGALELLREVVAQGNAAQKAEAKALIANLG